MKKTNKVAQILEVIARKTAESSANNRCMYLFHQPKQPINVKK